jgi:hypothetical protein
MQDLQAHLKTLRAQISECDRLRKAARSKVKREIFAKLGTHYRLLAGELAKLERAIAAVQASSTSSR